MNKERETFVVDYRVVAFVLLQIDSATQGGGARSPFPWTEDDLRGFDRG